MQLTMYLKKIFQLDPYTIYKNKLRQKPTYEVVESDQASRSK